MNPGRVLRLAVLGWGLGDLALGRRAAGLAWLAAELGAIAGVAFLVLAYADGSWYLLPFLAGAAFLIVWAAQATLAYRAALARSAPPDDGPSSGGSPAASLVWLTVPMLLWGTGFWLVAGSAASPGAVMDRFVGDWAAVADGTRDWDDGLTMEPAELTHVATNAVLNLGRYVCNVRYGDAGADCSTTTGLLRDVRVRISSDGPQRATAVAELVRYERRAASFLGLFATTELVVVPVTDILTVTLAADTAPMGGQRWTILNATTP